MFEALTDSVWKSYFVQSSDEARLSDLQEIRLSGAISLSNGAYYFSKNELKWLPFRLNFVKSWSLLKLH